MKKGILILLSVFGLLSAFAQRYDNTWLWGFKPDLQNSVNLKRGNAQGQFIGNNFVVTDTTKQTIFDNTNHSFSDNEGNSLFFTNGMRIRDSSALVIKNGDSLNYGAFWNYCLALEQNGYSSYYVIYSHFALPQPVSDSIFYLFQERADTVPPVWKGSVCYSIIKKRNDGKLEVIDKNHLLASFKPCYGGINACKHGNGRDWWISYVELGTNCLHNFLLTQDTLALYSTQCMGSVFDNTENVKAYFSQDGSLFIRTGSAHGTDIYTFDRCDGNIQLLHHLNPIFEIDTATGNPIDFIIGSDISTSNRYLYLTMSRYVFQYDLQAPDIEASIDTVGEIDYFVDTAFASGGTYYFNFTQYGPDGKIYIGPKGGCRFMSTIDYPDSGGTACHVGVRSVVLSKLNSFSLQFNPNYRLGRLIGSACDTIYSDIKPIYKDLPWLKVYPNPATDIVRFDYNWVEWEKITNCQLQITNYLGQVVMQQEIPSYTTRLEINIKGLANGVYTVCLRSGSPYRELEGNGATAAPRVLAVCKLTKQ